MNFKNHVKSDKVKWIFTTIVIVLICAVLVGLCYSVITGVAPQDWGKEDNSGTVDDTLIPDDGGEELPDNGGVETPDNGGDVVEDGGEEIPAEPVEASVDYSAPCYYYLEV